MNIAHSEKECAEGSIITQYSTPFTQHMLYASLCAFFQNYKRTKQSSLLQIHETPKILCISITLLFHIQQINPIAATSVNYFRTLQVQYMLFSLLKDA